MKDTVFSRSDIASSSPSSIGTLSRDIPPVGDISAIWRERWLASVRTQLARISELSKGWDGYEAPRVAHSTTIYASQLLQDLWAPGFAVPDISPMSSGGLMAEWIVDDSELTLEIEGPYEATCIYQSEGTEPDESSIKTDLRQLRAHLRELFPPAHIQLVA